MDNKEIIKNYFEAINTKEYSKAFDFLSDDLHWWILGNGKFSGEYDKRKTQIGFKLLHRQFKEILFFLEIFTSEEDRVSVTAETRGEHLNGKLYNNHYHFLFTLREGKIVKAREYLDTEHAIWIET